MLPLHGEETRTPSRGEAEFLGDTRPPVVILADDLFFTARLTDVVTACGGLPIVVETPEAFLDAVDRNDPVLTLLDLKTPGDWANAISRCKLRPHTKHIPIYAFGSHVDVATLQAARQAGADHAWARSKMMESLVEVVNNHIAPPTRYPAGWDQPLSRQAMAGVESFNAGDYFMQHEHFEEAWMAEDRPVREMYQGILQVGLAFLQIERGNWQGAIKMFRRGLPKLRSLPAVCQGLQVREFREAAEQIHREVAELGPKNLPEFDRSRFPRLAFAPTTIGQT